MPHTSEQNDSEKPPKKTRKGWWWRILLVLLAVVIVAGLLLNGPVSRWLIKDQMGKVADKQKLEGSFEVAGTLLSGYTLTDIDYTGDLGIQILKADRLEVRYRFRDLMNRKIGEVNVDSLKLRMDVAKFPKSEKPRETKEKEPREGGKGLSEIIRPWIIQSELSFTDLDVEVLKVEKPIVEVQFEAFSHAADSKDFEFKQFAAKNANRLDTKPQDILLHWEEKAVTIDQWELLPDLVLKKTIVDWSSSLKCVSGLVMNGAVLQAEIDDGILVELSEGPFSSSFIERTLGMNLPAECMVDALTFRVTDRKVPVADWEMAADLNIVSADFQKYQLRDSSLSLRQFGKKYAVTIKGDLNRTPVEVAVDGKWTAGDIWWKNTIADVSVNIPKVGSLPEIWMKKNVSIGYADTAITLDGKVELADSKVKHASAKGEISKVEVGSSALPPVLLDAYFENAVLKATVDLGESAPYDAKIDATVDFDHKAYDGSLAVNAEDPEWINALVGIAKPDMQLVGPTEITWTGSGKIEEKMVVAPQKGALQVTQLSVKMAKFPQIDLATKVNYDFPQSVELQSLVVNEENWKASGSLSWDGNTIVLPGLTVTNQEEEFVSLSGKIPYALDVKSGKAFFSQTADMDLHVAIKPLAFGEIEEKAGLKFPEGIDGKVAADMKISGSPASPNLEGYTNLIGVTGLSSKLEELMDLNLNFRSLGDSVEVTSVLQEGKVDILTLNGTAPFTPKKWIDDPKAALADLKEAPLEADCRINEFQLARIAKFVPQLEKITGTVSANGRFTGSINQPEYKLDLNAKVPLVEIATEAVGDIHDIVLDSTVSQDRIVSNKLKAQINGGKFEINGTVDINDLKKPIFDMGLQCNHALVFRNDLLSTRANGDLKLVGSIEEATISGTFGVTESLVYKDIEMIPIGVPSSAVAKVRLPAISSGSKKTLPIPDPFGKWKLDVLLETEDPILIRGNIASGEVEGSIKIGGVLKQPEPDGTIFVNNTKARLPFSILEIKKGEVIFTPKTGILNPELNITGTSQAGDSDINLLVYGNVSSPKTSLTSSPPYPESEIMSLIATGSTTSSLENTDAVALKAFKLFLLKLKEENHFGGNQLFDAVLSGLDTFDLQVGQADKFTGRKFSSAGLDLTKRWNLTAEIDEQQETRGLVVYQIRFK